MKNLKILLVVFLVITWATGFAQDSLDNKTLKELDNLALEYLSHGDTIKSRIYANYLIAKAKQTNDSLKIASAFYSHTLSNNIQEALDYSDSMIVYTKNSTHKFYPGVGYLMKAKGYNRGKQFDEALNNALIVDSLARLKNNTKQQLTIKQFIGNLYSHFGKYDEALEIHKEYYNAKENVGWSSKKNHARGLYNLSLSYMKVKKRDSARIYWGLSANKTREIGYQNFYRKKLVSLHSQIDFYDEKYNSALDTLVKYNGTSEGNDLANNYYYMGKIYSRKQNEALAIEYLAKMDSLILQGEKPFYHAKDGYAELSSIYKKQGNIEKQLNYINRYLIIDSVLSEDRETMDPLMLNRYMRPLLLEQKKQLLSIASKKQDWLNYLTPTFFLVLLLVVFLFIKQRKQTKRIRLLIENGIEKSTNSKIAKNENKQLIPDDIKIVLKQQLDEFEKSKGFLEIELTQSSLAKTFETNSSYLSKYINNEKGKNFPSYIKTLRIDNAMQCLKTDKSLLKYNIKGLAEKFGFQSSDAFSRAFQQETNVKPSQFIKELMKKKDR